MAGNQTEASEKRISELEADAKRWKDAFTTSQTHLDVVAEKLIPLLPGGWKHDWAGDVADGVSERITGLEAERDQLREQLAEARKDVERLDWLESDMPTSLIAWTDAASGCRSVQAGDWRCIGQDLRSAIDAAMKGPTNG